VSSLCGWCLCGQQGEQALFWAARQGHINVMQYLKDQCGLSLDAQNKVCHVPMCSVCVLGMYGMCYSYFVPLRPNSVFILDCILYSVTKITTNMGNNIDRLFLTSRSCLHED